jgi:hypothetical protein
MCGKVGALRGTVEVERWGLEESKVVVEKMAGKATAGSKPRVGRPLRLAVHEDQHVSYHVRSHIDLQHT